jgi:hypothetical protein
MRLISRLLVEACVSSESTVSVLHRQCPDTATWEVELERRVDRAVGKEAKATAAD